MRLLKPNKDRFLRLQNLAQSGYRFKLLTIIGLALAYLILFFLLGNQFGLFISIFLVLPVSAAGYHFGRKAGLLTGVFGSILNILLLTIYDGYPLAQVLRYWPGYLVILITGYFTGTLREESLARQRISYEFDSRERFITLITLATNSIINTKNPEDAYYRLASHIANLFIADYAHLIRWNEEKRRATLIATTRSIKKNFNPIVLKSDEAKIIEKVIQSGHPMMLEDVNDSAYVINPSQYRDSSIKTESALVIPFLTNDFSFGGIILAFNSPRTFSQEEVTYMDLVSNQIALVFRTIQQQQRIESQFKEARALANIGRALSETERVGVDRVLQLIVDSAMELIPNTKSVILHLLDKEEQVLVPRAVAGIAEVTRRKLNMRPGEGIAGHVMTTNEMIQIADIRNDHRFLDQGMPIKYRSLVVAPIKSREKCIGTISIQSDVTNAFNEYEVNILKTFGAQVSIGIDNANLLETLERRVQQRTHDLVVLYNLITIISENWRLQDLLELSLMLTLETVKADRGIIYLTDGKEPPDLKPVIQRGFSKGFNVSPNNLPDDELARLVFEQHKPVTMENLAENPTYARFETISSYAGVPILTRGNRRGVFSLFANKNDVFGHDEMALLTSIADHLGIGIENSILWEQSRESAALEERNRLARNLHDSVSQLLYSLTLMAGSTKKMLERDHDLEAVKNSVTRLGDTAHQALKEMRLLLYELRPAALESEGLVHALQHRIETVEGRLGVIVDLQTDGLPELPSDVEDALYHIALEALNNIVKHSGSTKANIIITSKNGNIVMKISDNGKGFDTRQPIKGQGLRNMRERGQMLGGEVVIDSTPGDGTQIRVKVKSQSTPIIKS